MNHKERMMAAIRGEAVDRIPYIPRLDLWYRANKYNNTLPEASMRSSLRRITTH